MPQIQASSPNVASLLTRFRAYRGDALCQALHELDVRGGHQTEVAHDAPLCQDSAKPSNCFGTLLERR